MAKSPATDLHPYVAAELAISAIKDGESWELEQYITLCAECESIAVRIPLSYGFVQKTIRRRGCHDEHATRHR